MLARAGAEADRVTAERNQQKVPFSETLPPTLCSGQRTHLTRGLGSYRRQEARKNKNKNTCAALSSKGRSFFVLFLFCFSFVSLLFFDQRKERRVAFDQKKKKKKVSRSWRMAGSSPNKDYRKLPVLSKHEAFPSNSGQRRLLTPRVGALP